MKLTRPANLSPKTHVRTIFLPSPTHTRINPSQKPGFSSQLLFQDVNDLGDRNENFLRRIDKIRKPKTNDQNFILEKIKQINLNEVSKRNKGKLRLDDNNKIVRNATTKPPSIITIRHRRRNDKFLHRRPTNPEDYELFMSVKERERPVGIDYFDCMTAGWGKFSSSGDLSDVLLKIDVPIHNIKRYDVEN